MTRPGPPDLLPGFTPPGRVRLSPAARRLASELSGAAARGGDPAGVVVFHWTDEHRRRVSRTEWRRSGPGLRVDLHDRRLVPANMIETVDGVEVAVRVPPHILQRRPDPVIDTEPDDPSAVRLV